MGTVLVLFNRDLRVHDHPALAAAARRADRVLPLFVLDELLLASRIAAPNRLALLAESLAELDDALKARGARLVVRRGDPVREAVGLARDSGADAIFTSTDVSAYAQSRERRLARACEDERIELRSFAGPSVVAPGALLPSGGGDHFKVFTPYWRRWQLEPLRKLEPAPRRLRLPTGVAAGRLPSSRALAGTGVSAERQSGGETAARKHLTSWLRTGLPHYERLHDQLEGSTSQLSAWLRFGCLSARELIERAGRGSGAEAFIRQLCWRDFFAQVMAARPDSAGSDYRPRGDRWNNDTDALDAWKHGLTGFPIVDAGMRQLAREGYMHNRARLIVASFLTKDLYLDWRDGAQHFWDLLLDGDLPNNVLNWQWVAGTGNDSRPNRVLNPITQAKRYDPTGDYTRHYLPELESVEGGRVHTPWILPAAQRRDLDYPEPIVDHGAAAARFKRRRV
jgi:deoxyribodipyrimidine photo-lyase